MSSSYSVRIPEPSMKVLEQLAQFSTSDGRDLNVYWNRSSNQAILHFGENWYIQNDRYILDSISEIVGVKESVIYVRNIYAGNMYDLSTFKLMDAEMARAFYNCKWSDYTCDYIILKADLWYPLD